MSGLATFPLSSPIPGALARNPLPFWNTGNLFAWERLQVPGCTFPFRIFPSCRGAHELGNKYFHCVWKMHSAQPPPSPLFPSLLFFFSYTFSVGRKALDSLARFPSGKPVSYLECKGLKRSWVPALAPEKEGPSPPPRKLPASFGHSPSSPGLPSFALPAPH